MRIELLKKELLGPELESIYQRIDRKIEMCRDELRGDMHLSVEKMDYVVKEKVTLVNEVID